MSTSDTPKSKFPAAASVDDILQHFDRTSDQFFSRDEFAAKLKSGKKLRIKYGVDVTAPTLHIGHAVNLWLMRYMQNLGHKIVFLIGDFTTRIGDPDGRMAARPEIPRNEIEKNAKAFIDQAKMVLRFDDPELIEIRRNSEWLDKLSLQDFLDLLKHVTHARLISRDMFQKRIAEKREIHMHEMLYPVLQGWDSVAIQSDLTIIGSDQLFNEMMGRFFQEREGQKAQSIITTKITPGTDGKAKQSKSIGNYIGLAHSPRDKFGRVMSIPDALIDDYFRVYTDMPLSEIDRISADIIREPRRMKAQLAYAIVGRYHGHDVAKAEQDWFDNTFSKKRVPDGIPVLSVMQPHTTALELVALAHKDKSRGHARRLVTQGAVEVNDKKCLDPDAPLVVDTNDVLHIGKREWYRIEVVKLNAFDTERLMFKALEVEDITLVRRYLPEWEIVKYLGQMTMSKKDAERIAQEVFKKVIFKPEPKDEWLWKIVDKSDPSRIVGLAHLRNEGGIGHENVWMAEQFRSNGFAEEAIHAVNEQAFAQLGLQRMVFKNAFAHAAAPQEMEVLMKRFMMMDSEGRNREDPEGTWGFTKEGWLYMKQQIRHMTPEVNTLMTDSNMTKKKKDTTRKLKAGFSRGKTTANALPQTPEQQVSEQQPVPEAAQKPAEPAKPAAAKPKTPDPSGGMA